MKALPLKCVRALHAVAKHDIVMVSCGHDVLGEAWPKYQTMSHCSATCYCLVNLTMPDPYTLAQHALHAALHSQGVNPSSH